MLINKQKIRLDFDMNMNNHIISKVENVKYLGVVSDNKLSWNSHIAQVKKTNIQSLWSSFKDKTLPCNQFLDNGIL